MEKRLRSSLQNSSEEFLVSATKLGLKSAKPSLKTLIHSLNPSSELAESLPISLRRSISQATDQFKQFPDSSNTASFTTSPPSKRLRRSARKSSEKSGKRNNTDKCENGKSNVVEDLKVYAFVALMCISHPKKAFPPSELLPAVRELHDTLILFDSDPVLLSEIASLCEEWWKEQLPGRETLISQTLPFLLSRSLILKKKVDVHRVYSLREALTLFDFEDESIEDVKLLLIRCLIAPLYLKTDDGRKFLAFIFGLSLQLVKEAVAMIRSQIPFGRKSMLEAYGDIVFRAWKAVDGELKDEIENNLLQGLIDSAIHASSSAFAASIRRILSGFINQRTVDGVEKLLFCLAEPVIFRSLQVANSNVRQNALHLLLDLFPLEDPNSTKEAKDTLLDKQFFLLEKLLMDECPEIRVIAVEGCCRILHLFWEIIPSSTITKLITKILDDMVHDAWNDVRLSTVNGIVYLLGNPHSHEILKVLLQRLGHLISDSALSVRAAVCDLLLLLSDIRGFPFHKVVPLDPLLLALANDQELVARKITKLLLPSYFPSKISTEEACNRCLALVKRNSSAGSRFCEFAYSEGAYLQSLMELFKSFITLILSPNDLNPDQVDSLITASAHLCKFLVTEAFYRVSLKEDLPSEKLKQLFCEAASGPAQSSVCDIISILAPDSADDLLDLCMKLVTDCGDLNGNLERQSKVRSVHRMMLSCGWFGHMFETLTRLLEKNVNGCSKNVGKKDTTGTAKKRKSSVKKSGKKTFVGDSSERFEEDYGICVGISWQIKELAKDEDARKAMLESDILEDSFSALKILAEVSIVQCIQWDFLNYSPVLAYADLAIHLSVRNVTFNGKKSRSMKKKCPSDSLEENLLHKTMDHLLNCANKLFEAYEEPNNSGGLNSLNQKRISNAINLLTAILKFIVDASTDLISRDQEMLIKFTLEYLDFLMTASRQQYKEEELKETFPCLRSSFTYAAKLLNLLLTTSEDSPYLLECSVLSNKLIDLMVSIEKNLGSGYATRIVGSVKPWLPDLILALGATLLKQTQKEKTNDVPPWLLVLARVEVCELSEAEADDKEEYRFSAFQKLIAMMVQLLRANLEVLDSVGVVFLESLLVGIQRKDFGLVLGIVHFVCKKLVSHEDGEWGELNLMLDYVRGIYPVMEKEAEDYDNNNVDEDGRQKLRMAILLIQPVWMCYMSETGREPMEGE